MLKYFYTRLSLRRTALLSLCFLAVFGGLILANILGLLFFKQVFSIFSLAWWMLLGVYLKKYTGQSSTLYSFSFWILVGALIGYLGFLVGRLSGDGTLSEDYKLVIASLNAGLMIGANILFWRKNSNQSINSSLCLSLLLLLVLTLYLWLDGIADFLREEEDKLDVLFVGGVLVTEVIIVAREFWIQLRKCRKGYTFNEPIANSKSATSKEVDRALVNTEEEEFRQIQGRLALYYEQNKGFTAADFTLKHLAQEIKISDGELSAYLKGYEKCSFYQYLGALKVAYSIECMKQLPAYYKLEVIMEKAGFRSRSSFVRHFKKCKGLTPSEYRKGLKN